MKRDLRTSNNKTPVRNNLKSKRQNQNRSPAKSNEATDPPLRTSSAANSLERSNATGRDPRIDDAISSLDELIRSRPESSGRAKSLKLLLERTSRSAEEEFLAHKILYVTKDSPRAQLGELMVQIYSVLSLSTSDQPPPRPAQSKQVNIRQIAEIYRDFRAQVRFYFSQPKESKSTTSDESDGYESRDFEFEQILEEKRTIDGWKFGTLPGSEAGHLVKNISGDDELVKKIVSTWEEMMKMNIRKGETYHERFELLKNGKAENEEIDIQEKEHTHPFIFGILRTFFRIYSRENIYSLHHTARILNDMTESEKEYMSNSSLYLYTKEEAVEDDATKVTKKESLNEISTYSNDDRRPDAAFFQRGTPLTDNDDVKYDSTARNHGLLVGVEAKRNLRNDNMNDALFECQRDYAHLSQTFAINKNRVGFSIITDGVNWYFLCISWQLIFGPNRHEWKHFIRQSKQIKFETDEEKTELAKWLLFVLNLSLTQPNLSADAHKEFSNTKFGEFSLTGIFHDGNRSTVSLWQRNKSESYVLKRFDIAEAVRQQKNIKYLKRELGYLEKLASYENIVSLVYTMLDVEYGFWLEYGGTPLENMDICGKRGQQLAVIVKRDIWHGALAALKAEKICHGDIHESNILICLKKNKATLIDFESAKDFGRNMRDSPIRHRYEEYYKFANEDLDKIALATTLDYLWDPRKTHFDRHLKEKLLELKEKIDREKRKLRNNRWLKPKGTQEEVEEEIRIASFKAVFDPILDPITNTPGHDSTTDGNAEDTIYSSGLEDKKIDWSKLDE